MNEKLYHMVPKDMKGDKLVPLSKLKEMDTDLYIKEISKYKDREHLVEQKIPTLKEATWADVLNFSPVHPAIVQEALAKHGGKLNSDEFFEIDPNLLDKENTTLFLHKYNDVERKLEDDNFIEYNPNQLSLYSELPQSTKDYYEQMEKLGQEPKPYHKIPHILHQGELDIKNIKKIKI